MAVTGVLIVIGGVTPIHLAGSGLALILGFAFAVAPQRQAVMRVGHLGWSREELCRHVLITGDTGCGKTSSGFNNLLVHLTKSLPNWGGLVVGVKGDETEFLTELLSENRRLKNLVHLQVRPANALESWAPQHRFNLLSDRSLPWTAHAKAIVDTAASMTQGRQDAFFKPMAQMALANALHLLEQLERPVTLVRAYHLLTSERILKEALEELEQSPPTEELIRLSDFFHSTFVEAKAHEQGEGIEGTIKTYLGFFLDPDLAEVFCSDQPNTVEIGQVDDGAIIAGMQSEVSADPAIGRDKHKVLALNFRTRFIFHAADMEGATASADFIGKKQVWKKSRSSKAWGSVSHTRREEEDYKFKPAKLMDLRDHTAVVVHPSKRFVRKRIVPVDGRGKVPLWFHKWGI